MFEFFIPFPGNQGRFHLVDSLCLFDNAHIGYNVIISTESIMFRRINCILKLLFNMLCIQFRLKFIPDLAGDERELF
ncbi:hypothetical protein EAY23_10790 [Escherichia coli]|nr:hypothetical protein [Escherichia coli]